MWIVLILCTTVFTYTCRVAVTLAHPRRTWALPIRKPLDEHPTFGALFLYLFLCNRCAVYVGLVPCTSITCALWPPAHFTTVQFISNMFNTLTCLTCSSELTSNAPWIGGAIHTLSCCDHCHAEAPSICRRSVPYSQTSEAGMGGSKWLHLFSAFRAGDKAGMRGLGCDVAVHETCDCG